MSDYNEISKSWSDELRAKCSKGVCPVSARGWSILDTIISYPLPDTGDFVQKFKLQHDAESVWIESNGISYSQMDNVKANTWYSFRLPISLKDTFREQRFLKVKYQTYRPDVLFTTLSFD